MTSQSQPILASNGQPEAAPSVPEMVERVAAAMWAFADAKDPTEGATWESIYPEVRMALRDWARVAITAMREPTEAMMTAMQESGVFDEVNGMISFCHARGSHRGGLKTAPMPAAYTIMVDAALIAASERSEESSPRQVVGEVPGTTPKDKTL